ncbi:MAG: flagellar basal body rod modification protein [Elusimicrobia bacterium ADurb.Bin231]|nr:MAG: flagellar basal body rod modification protein [Elusimicrobia bacterium ADurb.Bin231]
MKKFILFLSVFLLLPVLVSAAAMTPELIRVRNYAGPIAVTFGASGGDVGDQPSQFVIYLATYTIPGVKATADADTGIIKINVFDVNNSTYIYTKAEDKTVYFVRVAVLDDDNEWSGMSAESVDTSLFNKLRAAVMPSLYTIDYDSQTAVIRFFIQDINGGPAYPQDLVVDIQKSDGSSILKETLKYENFTIYPTSASCVLSWDGGWTAHGCGSVVSLFDITGGLLGYSVGGGHKHSGTYSIKATPTGFDGVAGQIGVNSVGVDVIRVNTGKGLIYTTGGTNMTFYGPPFTIDYYLSKGGYVTWRIFDKNQTETITDDTLVRTVVSSAPRVCGDSNSPSAIDDMGNQEIWDGRDNAGAIVPNGIYRYEFQAFEMWDESGSGYVDATTDRSQIVSGNIVYDTLRITDLQTSGITSTKGTASISYTLGGANQVQGGANVKIIICKPNTRFSMAFTTGTLNYLNEHSYNYVPGDLLPYTTYNLLTPATAQIVKTFLFARQAGTQSETWDGKDEDGATLANDLYVYGLSATDDSGNHAIDNSGNDQPIWGNITIDRTAAQAAGDTVAPSVASLTPAAGAVLSAGIYKISCVVTDTAQSGVSASGFSMAASTIIITGPDGNITGTKNYASSTGEFSLLFASTVTTNGVYTARVTPADNAGNSASETTWTFTISISSGASVSGDSLAPSIASLTPAGSLILTTAVSSVSCVITDLAQSGVAVSGVDSTNTSITVTGPNGVVTGAKTFDAVTGTLLLSFTQPLSTNGTYTVKVTPKDLAGNAASETSWSFTLNIPVFKDSVKAYPNPAKNTPITFAYNVASASAKITLEVYNILGELIYKQEWTRSAGSYTDQWALINEANTKVASGIYVYKLKSNDGISAYEVAKKVVVIQ